MDKLVVQYLVFGMDRSWRFLDEEEKVRYREEFKSSLKDEDITTYTYSLTGLKPQCDALLWRISKSLESLQNSTSRMLRTNFGKYMNLKYIMTGLTRPSQYVKKPTTQEQGMLVPDRKKYIIVYPFTKTSEWYLLKKETRQGMMNEHIVVGRKFPEVRQLLAYSFGIDDQEFIVAYETDDLWTFQDLVMALRETDARRYTLKDTPIFTGIYRSVEELIEILG